MRKVAAHRLIHLPPPRVRRDAAASACEAAGAQMCSAGSENSLPCRAAIFPRQASAEDVDSEFLFYTRHMLREKTREADAALLYAPLRVSNMPASERYRVQRWRVEARKIKARKRIDIVFPATQRDLVHVC